MKAAYRSNYGDHSVVGVKEFPIPKIKKNQVLIKVMACTVNRTDCGLLLASPWIIRLLQGLFKPSSPFLGTDFAGVIEKTGDNVSNFHAGDKVWGFDDDGIGSQAQYIVRDARKPMAIIPDNVSYDIAAASSEGAHYALNFINKVRINPNQKILVNGATGAIGSALLQLAKAGGNYVTAVGPTEFLEEIESLGADKIIDFRKQDFTTDDEKYDFVFDAVGKSRFKFCKKLLNPGGVYISSELGPNSENLLLALTTKLTNGKKVIFPVPVNISRSLEIISTHLEESTFDPMIDRSYSLDDILNAYKYVLSGQKKGNVIVHPWE